MKRILGGIALAGLVATLAANTAAAQIYNMPVFFSPNFGTGVGVFGNFGYGLNEDAEILTGEKPWAAGGHVYVGTPIVHFMGGAAYVEPNAPETLTFGGSVSFGANVAVTLFKAPMSLVVVNLQAGGGYVNFSDLDAKYLDFPAGIGLAIDVPSPVVHFEPWLGARAHIRISDLEAGSPLIDPAATADDYGTQVGFGLSGGINLDLPIGFGAWGALDWMTIKPYSGGESGSPLLLGGGLYWKFQVPSLGIPTGLL